MIDTDSGRIVGCLVGTAIGDALGLPYEGLSRRRALKMLGPPDRYRFLFGRGMVSDDTEHACMVAQSLIAAGNDVNAFQQALAWRLRLWLLGIPAGTGMATLRSVLRLWIGISPERSGIFSAGNGPAMRAAILGASLDEPRLHEYVRAATRITHTDPKAEYGALAVALAANSAARHQTISPNDYLDRLCRVLGDDAQELLTLVKQVVMSIDARQSTIAFADSLGFTSRVSGYIYQTVPVALHAWLANRRDYRTAVTSIIQCGGDTDSTAAIVGGIVGTTVGVEGIPHEWMRNLLEWPRSKSWMHELGTVLALRIQSGQPALPPRLPALGLLMRNLLFTAVVLFHGFRRLAPPY